MSSSIKPWSILPKELLEEADRLISLDTETSRRIAFILIDNSVELTLKAHIGLPKRINGIEVTREQIDKANRYFPELITLAEEKLTFSDSLIDLGQIEWMHRVRNSIYHDGVALNPNKQVTEYYFLMASALQKDIFKIEEPEDQTTTETNILGRFLRSWISVERTIRDLVFETDQANQVHMIRTFRTQINYLFENQRISEDQYASLEKLWNIRSHIFHGLGDQFEAELGNIVGEAETLSESLKT